MALNHRAAHGIAALTLLSLAAAGCIVASDDSVNQQTQDATETYWTCSGTTGYHVPPDGHFYTTSFGCWVDEQGNDRGDPSDNCIPWCQSGDASGYAEHCAGLSGPECERQIRWYAADADRFGCFSRIRATNPDNGKSVVLLVMDRGPNCYVERKVDHWVLDMSYPASIYLFGEPTSAEERAGVIVEPVSSTTPLGPNEEPVPFVGDGCSSATDCDFQADGEAGMCSLYGVQDEVDLGFCTIPCAGYCPDKAGKATTFCASLDGDYSGTCLSKSSAPNGYCSSLPGMEARELPRFIGDSSASASTATVCVPDWLP